MGQGVRKFKRLQGKVAGCWDSEHGKDSKPLAGGAACRAWPPCPLSSNGARASSTHQWLVYRIAHWKLLHVGWTLGAG